MAIESGHGKGRVALRGMIVVAAAFFAFLLFAQFAFVRILQGTLGGESAVRQAMVAMGLAGCLSSLWAGWLLGRVASHRLIVSGFVLCATSALAATVMKSLGGAMVLSAAIGVSIALLTVAVATELPRLIPVRGRGLRVGLATGVAYFACNLPPLFNAPGEIQASTVALVCGIGALVTPRLAKVSVDREAAAHRPLRSGRLVFGTVLVSFLALVWIDSAAFNIIQQSVSLRGLTWGGPGQLTLLGTVHLAAATFAGLVIDRRRLGSLLPAAFALFVVAFTFLQRGAIGLAWAGPLYAVGISLYSVALVSFPSNALGGATTRWRAALLYGIAGWVGSALGVGMAQDLHRIPTLFLICAAIALASGWLVTRLRTVSALLRIAMPTVAWACGALLVAGLAGGFSWVRSPSDALDPAAAIARGREIYVSEGCINCHSQFLRPGTHDEELWGPLRPIGPDESPPLIGMRRQGPDLMNAGNRRSALWHRMHLLDPQALSPGTRMPSYAHLFEGGDGDDLVAFLSSLGRETAQSRFEYSQAAEVPDPATTGSAEMGAALFERHCQVCHGTTGRGDGPLGQEIGRPAMNLRKGSFWLVSWGPGLGSQVEGLARVIKFGVPGTSMPGHEYFSDQEIADLSMYVAGLAEGPADEPRVAASRAPDGETLE